MKVLCDTSSQSVRNRLYKLYGTDTWIKVYSGNPDIGYEYIQVLYMSGDSDRIIVRSVCAECVEGYIEDNPEDAFCIDDVLEDTEIYYISLIEIVQPESLMETWEIVSALEFTGYLNYDEEDFE